MLMPSGPVVVSTPDFDQGAGAGMPDVSFIIPTYDVAPYIEDAIVSALSQNGVRTEVIISDDGSSDATPDIVARIAEREPRIRLLRNRRRTGPSGARNRAIAAARGHWLSLLDGDDMIAPERSRTLIELAELAGADMVADSFERFGDHQRSGAHLVRQASVPYSFAVDIAAAMRGNCAFGARGAALGAIKPMIRRQFWLKHKLAYRSKIAYGEDFLLLISALEAGARFIVTSQSLYHYRMRTSSQSFRLGLEQIDALIGAHDELALETRHADQPETIEAARAYRRDLLRARTLTNVADKARSGDAAGAMRDALMHPECWWLMARHAGEAVIKRLRGQR